MLDTTGLSADQINLLEYVRELMQHGMQPRIVNVTTDEVKDEWAVYHVEHAPLTDDEAWTLARQADEEVENDHHFLDGVRESFNEAIGDVLDLRDELLVEERQVDELHHTGKHELDAEAEAEAQE